jgi:hypothetical protein
MCYDAVVLANKWKIRTCSLKTGVKNVLLTLLSQIKIFLAFYKQTGLASYYPLFHLLPLSQVQSPLIEDFFLCESH